MSGTQRRIKNTNKNTQNEHRTASNSNKNKKKKGAKGDNLNQKVETVKVDPKQIIPKKNEFVDETLEANQQLWSELREHILYLYKIGRDQNLAPTTVDRVKYLVDTLCTKDIHQLFIRLELLATDVIKEWLESVERIFVNEVRNTTIAYNYLENVITDCGSYLMSARKMLPMLRSLESHLRKFNMCWVLIHQNLFRVHYLEENRCVARTKKAKLLLLSDVEIPVFAETILKFARFNEVFNALSEEWSEANKKVQAYRDPHPVYKHYDVYFKREWQNFPSIKKKNKPNTSKPTVLATHSKATVKKQDNRNNIRLPNVELRPTVTQLWVPKTQSKKARRKAAADHSRQPSADLMPPPPPRITEADLNHFRSESASECDSSNDRCQHNVKKSEVAPQTPVRRQHLSQVLTNSKLSSSDNRDLDELVAFVEGMNLNENQVDEVESENKKRRKKQKKEKQRLKKIQTLMEEEDQVAQLMKRSPGVTITMVRSDNPTENCHHSHQLFNSINSKPPVPPPKPPVPVAKPAPQPTPPAAVNGSTLSYNPGSRMVTIRRITEANTDEPTVTITLKGPTPDQDQVLYRIINGQADYGHLADNILTKNPRSDENIPTEPLTKKQKKKLKKQKENQLPIESTEPGSYDPAQYSENNEGNGYGFYDNDFIRITKVPIPEEEVPIIISGSKKSKKQKKQAQKTGETVLDQPIKNPPVNNQKTKKTNIELSLSVKDNLMVKMTNRLTSQIKPSKTPQPAVKPVKSQDASKQPQKPPPKNEKSKPKEQPQTTKASKQKLEKQTNGKQKVDLVNNTQNAQKVKDSTKASKRKSNADSKTPSYQPNEFLVENNNNYKLIPENLRLPAGITITKVTANVVEQYHKLTKHQKFKGVDPTCINFGEGSNITNPAFQPSDPGKVDVVIESQPVVAPQQYLQHQQLHHNVICDGDYDMAVPPENRQPPIGTGVPRTLDAPAKFIRAPDGRIIIRSPMAARSTSPPLNPITMIRQDLEMGVAPPVPVSPFWTRNDWWLPGADNVFAPKDIDLEDNTLDAAERELEAFKRFCQEPVPPQRQEATHLNVNKIIIKKNNQHS